MLKSVSKVSDLSTIWLFTEYMSVMVSQHMTSWQLCQKWVTACDVCDNNVKNQGTNAIIIALIFLSLDPIVKSGLHDTGVQ